MRIQGMNSEPCLSWGAGLGWMVQGIRVARNQDVKTQPLGSSDPRGAVVTSHPSAVQPTPSPALEAVGALRVGLHSERASRRQRMAINLEGRERDRDRETQRQRPRDRGRDAKGWAQARPRLRH